MSPRRARRASVQGQVCIKINGRRFSADRERVQSQSHYFRALLSGQWREDARGVVRIDNEAEEAAVELAWQWLSDESWPEFSEINVTVALVGAIELAIEWHFHNTITDRVLRQILADPLLGQERLDVTLLVLAHLWYHRLSFPAPPRFWYAWAGQLYRCLGPKLGFYIADYHRFANHELGKASPELFLLVGQILESLIDLEAYPMRRLMHRQLLWGQLLDPWPAPDLMRPWCPDLLSVLTDGAVTVPADMKTRGRNILVDKQVFEERKRAVLPGWLLDTPRLWHDMAWMGSSLIHAMVDYDTDYDDIDLFFINDSDGTRVREFLKSVAQHHPDAQVITRYRIVEIFGVVPDHKLQLVVTDDKHYKDFFDLVHCFDFAHLQCFYTPLRGGLRLTPSARLAYATFTTFNFCSPIVPGTRARRRYERVRDAGWNVWRRAGNSYNSSEYRLYPKSRSDYPALPPPPRDDVSVASAAVTKDDLSGQLLADTVRQLHALTGAWNGPRSVDNALQSPCFLAYLLPSRQPIVGVHAENVVMPYPEVRRQRFVSWRTELDPLYPRPLRLLPIPGTTRAPLPAAQAVAWSGDWRTLRTLLLTSAVGCYFGHDRHPQTGRPSASYVRFSSASDEGIRRLQELTWICTQALEELLKIHKQREWVPLSLTPDNEGEVRVELQHYGGGMPEGTLLFGDLSLAIIQFHQRESGALVAEPLFELIDYSTVALDR